MLNFNKRKTWSFQSKTKNRQISIEISGFDNKPSISISADGSESEVVFHIGFIIGIWITFSRFIPHSWLPEDRALKLYWFESAIWWNLWMPENSWNHTDPKWRRNSIHFDRIIEGKHTMEKRTLISEEFLLPFFEGSYKVGVVKYERLDRYQRWFTRKSIAFEVTVLSAKGIPHAGKGENSWDQDETYTSSSWFHGHPHRDRLYTCYDAALYFWHSCMKTRERYGSSRWIPEKFRNKEIQMA